jgi:hypothetical protein
MDGDEYYLPQTLAKMSGDAADDVVLLALGSSGY